MARVFDSSLSGNLFTKSQGDFSPSKVFHKSVSLYQKKLKKKFAVPLTNKALECYVTNRLLSGKKNPSNPT